MKKFSKLLALSLAIVMCLSVFAGAVTYKDADKINPKAKTAVEWMDLYGIMQGDELGNFKPQSNLRRIEMFKIVTALIEGGHISINPVYGAMLNSSVLKDINKIQAWGLSYAGYVVYNKIFVGDYKSMLNPEGNLTYVECAIVLLRALGVNWVETRDGVIDRYTGNSWYDNAVADALKYGLLNNLTATATNLSAAVITREDIAIMVYNAIKVSRDNANDFPCEDYNVYDGLVDGLVKDGKNYFARLYDISADTNEFYFPIAADEGSKYLGKRVIFSDSNEGEDTVIVSEPTIIPMDTVETKLGDVKAVKNSSDKYDLKIGSVTLAVGASSESNLNDAINVALFYKGGNEIYGVGTLAGLKAMVGTFEHQSYQPITVSYISGKVGGTTKYAIVVNYSPTYYAIFDPAQVKAEKVDNKATGNYTYGEYYVDSSLRALTTKTWVGIKLSAMAIGNDNLIASLASLPVVTQVNGNKLTGSLSGGKYTFKLNGEAVVLATKYQLVDGTIIAAADLYTGYSGVKADADPKYVVVDNGIIVGVDGVKAPAGSDRYMIYTTVSNTIISGDAYVSFTGVINGAVETINVKAADVTGSPANKDFVKFTSDGKAAKTTAVVKATVTEFVGLASVTTMKVTGESEALKITEDTVIYYLDKDGKVIAAPESTLVISSTFNAGKYNAYYVADGDNNLSFVYIQGPNELV